MRLLFVFYRVELHSHVWSVRKGGCATKAACLSHYCVPQDTIVLLGPLLLDPALRSVSCLCVQGSLSRFDASLPSLVFQKVLIVFMWINHLSIIAVLLWYYVIIQGTYSDQPGGNVILHCRPCEAGWYCSKAGLSEPEGPCNSGHYCTSGASTASPVSIVLSWSMLHKSAQ